MPKTDTIAIIDDDASVREATRGLLRSLGYSASTFASAEEFLSSDTIAGTSCVITDIRMHGMSGIALQQRLLDDGYRLPVIFMTAFPDDRIKERALAAGARGFLIKPYQESNLVQCIETALHA